MLNAVILIDGGYVRAAFKNDTRTPANKTKRRGRPFPNSRVILNIIDSIKSIITDKLGGGERGVRWIRSYYYDTDPFQGTLTQPNGHVVPYSHTNGATDQKKLLNDLHQVDQLAVRLGVLKFRAWETTSTGYKPIFQQKGVDMKIGLDIAWIATKHIADVIVLVTADSDFASPMKLARREGVVVCLCSLTEQPLTIDLVKHADVVIRV
jgi:uncharacterized LabA/DUF88 family protein